jgi:hypothetical protein
MTMYSYTMPTFSSSFPPPSNEKIHSTRKALPTHSNNLPLPPSERNDTKDRRPGLSFNVLNASNATRVPLKTKRRMVSLLRIWPWLQIRPRREYNWFELRNQPRKQSPKPKGGFRVYSKIRLRQRKGKKAEILGQHNGLSPRTTIARFSTYRSYYRKTGWGPRNGGWCLSRKCLPERVRSIE